MVAVTVAVLLPLAWFYFRGETDSHLRSRTLEQAEISWRCERDHLFMAAGQDGSRICWICGAIAYPVGNYICEVHGAYEVAVQFVTDDAGITTVKQVRVPAVRTSLNLSQSRSHEQPLGRVSQADPMMISRRSR